MRNNRSTSNVDAAIARSIDFEVTIADLARRSERRAWRVAAVAVAMSLVLAGACFYMLPLKEKVPYLVMALTTTYPRVRIAVEAFNTAVGCVVQGLIAAAVLG